MFIGQDLTGYFINKEDFRTLLKLLNKGAEN